MNTCPWKPHTISFTIVPPRRKTKQNEDFTEHQVLSLSYEGYSKAETSKKIHCNFQHCS